MNLKNHLFGSGILIVLFIIMAASGETAVTVIDFESAYPTLNKSTTNPMPASYAGFQWSSTFRLMPREYVANSTSGLGYRNGMLGNVIAYTSGPEGSNGVHLSSTSPFNFGGAYITSVWKTNQDVVVRGFFQGQMLYRTIIYTSYDKAHWFEFNFMNIDRLEIAPGTGGEDFYSNYRGNHLAIDNITIIPEPSSVVLLAWGLIYARSRRQIVVF